MMMIHCRSIITKILLSTHDQKHILLHMRFPFFHNSKLNKVELCVVTTTLCCSHVCVGGWKIRISFVLIHAVGIRFGLLM